MQGAAPPQRPGRGDRWGLRDRAADSRAFLFLPQPHFASVTREAGRGGIRSPLRALKKISPPFFFFLKNHFLKGFLRVFRLGGRGWESGTSAAPPNHPACCAQSQPASPRLGAGLSTEGRTVAAAQGSRAWNALGAHSAAGRWSPLFLRRGPRGWLCRPCDDQAVLLLGDQQVPSLGRSLPMCTTTERNLNISKTLLL